MNRETIRRIGLFVLGCVFTAACAAGASADDMKFEASLDRSRIAIGETAQLGLSFYGTQSMPAPDIGNIDGLEVRYMGPSTMMTVINGRVSSSITHMYSILPLKVGKFQLGPFAFKYKNNNYTSNMVFLEVGEEKAVKAPAPKAEEPAVMEKLNIDDRMFLVLRLDKQSAYVNELVPVSIKLYVNRLNVSDITLPVFEQEGFSKVEFKEPTQYKEERDGVVYDVLEFNTKIFGTRAGDYRLGPAKLKCNVMVRKKVSKPSSFRDDMFADDQYRDSFFDDFFTRYEKHAMEIKSQDVPLTILALPSQGKPSDFMGAVGDYQFIYSASPAKVKVGDPVTVRMQINGSGNFNTVLIPKMASMTGFRAYESQVRTESNSKTFRQVLIPETDQVTQVPKATFSFFDPNQRIYRTITQGPITIQVEKGKEEAPSQIVGPAPVRETAGPKEEALTRDIVYIKESPGKWDQKERDFYKSKAIILLAVFPLIFLISLFIVEERRDSLKQDTARGRRIRALNAARAGIRSLRHQLRGDDQKVFYETVFKTLQDYLGNRLGVPAAGITSDIVEENLSAKDIDMDILRKIKNIFTTCDRAKFAFSTVDRDKMKDDMKELEEVVEYFERKKI